MIFQDNAEIRVKSKKDTEVIIMQQLTGYPSIDKPWLKYYSEEELNMILPNGTMYDNMYSMNKSHLDDIAIIYFNNKISYRQLFDKIDSCAGALAAIGVRKGNIVTIQSISIPQVIVLMYAINKIGAIGNMLYPNAQPNEIKESMDRTNSDFLFVFDKIFSSYEKSINDDFCERIILFNAADEMDLATKTVASFKVRYSFPQNLHLLMTWKQFIKLDKADFEECHDLSLTAFIVGTGGTTGIPKMVMLSNQNFNYVAEATRLTDMQKWERGSKNLNYLPPFIAFGISSGIHHPLCFGITSIITLDFTLANAGKAFAKYMPDCFIAGIAHVLRIIEEPSLNKKDFCFLKMIAAGGDSIPEAAEIKVNDFLRQHGSNIKLIKGYGMTETAGTVVAETISANKIGTLGIPLPLSNMKIVDLDSGNEVAYDKQGEICLCSKGIMIGYYENQTETDQVIERHDSELWIHTGDLGSIDKDGFLSITGRIKRIVIFVDGDVIHKIFPKILEEQFERITGVSSISIVGRKNEKTRNELVAFIIAENKSENDATKNKLREFAETTLKKYERPVEYIFVDSFPRTLIGKVDYRALEEMAESQCKGEQS